MVKLVDYSARFEFFRRAAFVVVRDRGPHALSRRTMAAALGMSHNTVRRLLAEDVDLRHLALDEVERRRSQGRWRRPRGLVGADLAVLLLATLLADEEDRVAEELVWLRIRIDACRPVVPDEESVAMLRTEHAIAERGFAPEEPDATVIPLLADPLADPLADRLAERDALVERVVAEALDVVGAGCEAEQRRTRALVDGLTLGTCLGRTTPEQAVTTLQQHVASFLTEARDTA